MEKELHSAQTVVKANTFEGSESNGEGSSVLVCSSRARSLKMEIYRFEQTKLSHQKSLQIWLKYFVPC